MCVWMERSRSQNGAAGAMISTVFLLRSFQSDCTLQPQLSFQGMAVAWILAFSPSPLPDIFMVKDSFYLWVYFSLCPFTCLKLTFFIHSLQTTRKQTKKANRSLLPHLTITVSLPFLLQISRMHESVPAAFTSASPICV